MGSVWLADHLGLHTKVVVKFIADEVARHPEAIARFEREAAAASQVKSPHVVQMLDHGVSPTGLAYIAMELLEGEDLASRLARQGAMRPGEVAGVVVQAARALSRAHEKGIIHRDIKPENVFLCETGEAEAFVKVLDFGIAKIAGTEQHGATQTGAMIGTAYFMSPEQVMGSKSIDPRSDLWSLGILAYFAMTGVRPFDGETIGAISVNICNGSFVTPSEHNGAIPPAVDEWFRKACAKDPAARFQNARAMADALVVAVGGTAVARVLSRDFSDGDEKTNVLFRLPSDGDAPLPAPAVRAPTGAKVVIETAPFLATTTSPASVRQTEVLMPAAAARPVAGQARRGLPVLLIGGVTAGIVVGGLTLALITMSSGSKPTVPTTSSTPATDDEAAATPARKTTARASASVIAAPDEEPAPAAIASNSATVAAKPSAPPPAPKPAGATAPTNSLVPRPTATAAAPTTKPTATGTKPTATSKPPTKASPGDVDFN
jgi:serine/threonine-protein kinase